MAEKLYIYSDKKFYKSFFITWLVLVFWKDMLKTLNYFPFKAWLGEFLLSRGLLRPSKKPLYTYQVSEREYQSLIVLLKQYIQCATSSAHVYYFSACFCLYVSEQYRRAYSGTWSWAGAEQALKIEFNQAQHADFTSKGMDYWRRPIRCREIGRDWLGTLFMEGGLPWNLVQRETHGFGRAVKRGIKFYYRAENNHRTTADLMSDFEDDLPQTFRNLETRQLLAGIVDQLMYLVDHFPLRTESDPAAYLDKHAPNWSADFPIPLDESNARVLMNEWLRDAGQKRVERKEAMVRAKAFTCEHFLSGDIPNWSICTELILPQEEAFQFDINLLTSTRFELAYYEGEKLLARGGVVYGQIKQGDDDINQLVIRFRTTQVSLERRVINEPVSLRLLNNGRTLHRFQFNDSEFDIDESPLIFENVADRWILSATASCTIAASIVRIRLPKELTFNGDLSGLEELGQDQTGGRWLDSITDLQLRKGSEHYAIELNRPQDSSNKPMLNGPCASFVSHPSIIYCGFPRLDLLDEYLNDKNDLQEYVNGQAWHGAYRSNFVGVAQYALRSKDNKTLLLRRFGILPKDFKISLVPSHSQKPARLEVETKASQLRMLVAGVTAKPVPLENKQGFCFELQHNGEVPPTDLTLEIRGENQHIPLQLQLSYPFHGARLIDADGKPATVSNLLLAELLGMRIILSSGAEKTVDFNMTLELYCEASPRPMQNYAIKVGATPVEINLFAYQNDMLQLLSAVDEQDAFIKLTLESDTTARLLVLTIRRYPGKLIWQKSSHCFAIADQAGVELIGSALVEAMLIPDPKRTVLNLKERASEGVPTGYFDIAPEMQQHLGPWLIYPSKQSPVLFRPALYIPDEVVSSVTEILSLHQATQAYRPKSNPDVINIQIQAMASDFHHDGWQYLADLKRHYAHLPLSTFESWKALSRNVNALAFAVLRLEMEENFCCRVRDELAVVWEAIPLPCWVGVYQQFNTALQTTGLPEYAAQNLMGNRSAVLRSVVSGFDYLGDYLTTGNFDDAQKASQEMILSLLPKWYEDLRKRHDANLHWPEDLSKALRLWIKDQPLPLAIKELSQIKFHNSVVYLPIFMAFVTANQAQLSDLHIEDAVLKFGLRKIAEFDRYNWYVPVHSMMTSYLLASINPM